jgi:hypothetical protein
MRRDWRPLAIAAIAMAVTGASHRGMDGSSPLERGELFVPTPAHARASSLGFDALLSDYYWLQAIQILGAQRAGVGDSAPLLGRLIDVVTTLDPWVGHPYRFAAVWLTDSPESVRQANRLLERGIAHHPRDWRNRHYLGFNHFYYLGDDTAAAEVLETAVGLPKAPRYLAALVAKLRMEGGGLDTAATFLTELAASTPDERARAEYLKALDEIEHARFLDQAREQYRERNGRDIEQVEDLLLGTSPVLRSLPPAHVQLPGFRWTLDEDTDLIVSSFYRARYRPYVHWRDEARRRSWGEARAGDAPGAADPEVEHREAEES